MKVVLFCGGLGTRLREFGDNIPKPLVPLGYRPILWHLMKYYAHFGDRDFILCLGYKADKLKEYFLHYDEAISNDFVLSQGARQVDPRCALYGRRTSAAAKLFAARFAKTERFSGVYQPRVKWNVRTAERAKSRLWQLSPSNKPHTSVALSPFGLTFG
jgi:hypothetical protein